MIITIGIINPRQKNGAGVWMISCPEEMGWEFGRFWKRFSWVSTMVWRSWVPTMVLRSWSPTMQLRIWDWTMHVDDWVCHCGIENWVSYRCGVFQVPSSEDELRSKTLWDVPNVGGGVSIVWYGRLLGTVPLLVHKNRTQKLINSSYLNNGVACVFASSACSCTCTRGIYDKFPDFFSYGHFYW